MTRTCELAWRFLMAIGRGFASSAIAYGAAIHPRLMWPDGVAARPTDRRPTAEA